MSRLKIFILDSGRWGVASEVAAFIVFVVGLVERADRPVSAFIFVCVSVPLFWLGAYAAWHKKHKKVEFLEGEREIPKIDLRYIRELSTFDCSGFFLKTEGEKTARNVQLSSEEVAGNDRVRLCLEWDNPGKPIENAAVHVRVMCGYSKGGLGKHAYNHVAGDQIRHFFNHKSQKPLEIVVTVSYTDIAGHPCPDRKFLIVRRENPLNKYLQDEEITCEPLTLGGVLNRRS